MAEYEFVFVLLAVILLTVFIYFIYQSVLEEKKEKERAEQEKEFEKQYQEDMRKIRKENSFVWNKKVQAKYNKNIKYTTNKKIKVLIGDYTDSMAPFTNSILRNMGIETEVVPTASDIIDRVKDGNDYDLIITNNTYSNGESGEKVLELKEEKDFSIPIVVLTVRHNSRMEFLSAGFDEYIEKPIDEKKVINVFTKFIDGLEFKKIKSNKSA
jgi:CheY-like chemotaxis protein/Na+-transporting methylmalonyl-CoA/oxaloacetate decarboxylase gamma subunit